MTERGARRVTNTGPSLTFGSGRSRVGPEATARLCRGGKTRTKLRKDCRTRGSPENSTPRQDASGERSSLDLSPLGTAGFPPVFGGPPRFACIARYPSSSCRRKKRPNLERSFMSLFAPNRRGVPGDDASRVWGSDGLAVSLTRLGGRWRGGGGKQGRQRSQEVDRQPRLRRRPDVRE